MKFPCEISYHAGKEHKSRRAANTLDMGYVCNRTEKVRKSCRAEVWQGKGQCWPHLSENQHGLWSQHKNKRS